jgi:hypothetical protein
MRLPDLKFIILKDFKQINQQEFFMKQEILLGKSFLDISLKDVNEVQKALSNYHENDHQEENSIMDNLVHDDQMRIRIIQ